MIFVTSPINYPQKDNHLEEYFKDIKLEKLYNTLIESVINFGGNILFAIGILIIGFWFSKKLTRLIHLRMTKSNVDPGLRSFLKNTIYLGLNIMVVLIATMQLGIEITSVIALIGGAAVGLGMGLQGGISNFAAGVMIIMTKPFSVGDLIKTHDYMGYVERIDLLNSTLRTVKNELVIIPNSELFNKPIINYSEKKVIRIDTQVGISYKDNFDELKTALKKAIKEEEIFLNSRPITVEIEAFGDSSVNLTIRAFTAVSNYWDAPLKLNYIARKTINENGFTIPFPQRDVHLYQTD